MPLNNLKVICLVLGIVAGGLVGYVTKPPQWVRVIPIFNIVVEAEPKEKGELTERQFNYVALCALIGGIVGFGVGVVGDRRRA
jgi:hypothetical protein